MSLDSVLVSNVMKTDVKTENENQDVMDVCKVMYENDIGCVVVIKEQGKDNIPVGIITEKDIISRIVKDPNMITDFVDHNYQKGREIYARFTERMLRLLPKL